jgi:hypothetical protein
MGHAKKPSVTDLRPLDTEESPFHYTFKVQCTSCRETHPNWVTVSRFVCLDLGSPCIRLSNLLLKQEMNEVSGSRGEANFVWKCKNCKVFLPFPHSYVPHANILYQREHSANIKAAPATYEQSDPPKTVNIIEFDCRGLEFVEFKADVSPCESGGANQH